MKFTTKARNSLLLAAITAGSYLYAQPADNSDTSTILKGTTTSKLSLTEMLTHSGELDQRVKGDLRHVKHLQEIARKQKDIIKLNCINDKLIEIKAQANLFDRFHHELDGMLAGNSSERVTVYAEVVEASENVHKGRAGADACAGEPELAREATNGYEHPPFPDDPTIGNPFSPGVEPPGYASPFN
jgi:hypothetical protein